MGYHVKGLSDIRTILENERKIGGAVEAKFLRLRSGEEYSCPVITNIDYAGVTFYSISFTSDEGERMIVHVNDISMIAEAAHKRICELTNKYVKKEKLEEKIRYLKRLCSLNEGIYTKPFIEEVKAIVEDISFDTANENVDLRFLKENGKLFKIA